MHFPQEQPDLGSQDQRKPQAEFQMPGFMMKEKHSGKTAGGAAEGCCCQKGRFPDPPAILNRAALIQAEEDKSQYICEDKIKE